MKSSLLTKIKAIIFDMDGVLIDAKEWHYESLNRALEHYGFSTISRADHLGKYDGLPTKEKIKIYHETKDLKEEWHTKINVQKQKIVSQIIDKKCIPNDLHQHTLKTLKAEGYRLAVCSNAIRNSVGSMLSKSQILQYIEFFLSNQDVVFPKPDPEMYLLAIRKLGLQSNNVLICEDNIRGIQAAKESGAYVLEIGTINDVTYENIITTIKKIERGEIKQMSRPPVRTARLSEMSGGWFVGNFFPNILETKDFEVAVKYYKKGDYIEWHVHKMSTEITVILEGSAEMGEKLLKDGDIILLEPGQGTFFKALSDLKTVVVKTPSIQGDKYFKEAFKK